MSVITLGFRGETINALVVGGGNVGTRRALALLEAGARVRVIAPEISRELDSQNDCASPAFERLSVERREYAGETDIGDADLVVAATASSDVNDRISRDARVARVPVNVADSVEKGNFAFLATHRAGPITIGVSAGSVPNAAGRIRDSIGERIDSRYAEAVKVCGDIRRDTLASGGAEAWRQIASEMIDATFCDSVESGTFAERAKRWR